MWRIELNAPQYPEGLNLLIFANKLAGNVDIINGLNHYIGMKTLHTDDFIEFTLLPYIISIFALACIATAIFGNRKWLNIVFTCFVIFGIVAMVDFWRWEYNYGHNLNPEAAIIVPGMAYQPPLIGFKQLLNFGAYSVPDIGGWLFIGAGAILLLLVIFEWKKEKRIKALRNGLTAMSSLLLTLLLHSCQTSPETIQLGKDNCSFCKMTITDNRFGAEIITLKGKIYKFDDGHCLLAFIKAGSIAKKNVKDYYLTDYTGNHDLINSKDAKFLQSERINGPMNGHWAAFSNEDSMNKIAAQYTGSTFLQHMPEE
jgi:copper chaperone NosL